MLNCMFRWMTVQCEAMANPPPHRTADEENDQESNQNQNMESEIKENEKTE